MMEVYQDGIEKGEECIIPIGIYAGYRFND